jgi:hypothetical protein
MSKKAEVRSPETDAIYEGYPVKVIEYVPSTNEYFVEVKQGDDVILTNDRIYVDGEDLKDAKVAKVVTTGKGAFAYPVIKETARFYKVASNNEGIFGLLKKSAEEVTISDYVYPSGEFVQVSDIVTLPEDKVMAGVEIDPEKDRWKVAAFRTDGKAVLFHQGFKDAAGNIVHSNQLSAVVYPKQCQLITASVAPLNRYIWTEDVGFVEVPLEAFVALADSHHVYQSRDAQIMVAMAPDVDDQLGTLAEFFEQFFFLMGKTAADSALTEEQEGLLLEWTELDNELSKAKASVATINKKHKALHDELLPIVKTLTDQQAIVNDVLVKVQVRTASSNKYREWLFAALEKVNADTRKVLEGMKSEFITKIPKEYLKRSAGETGFWDKLAEDVKELHSTLEEDLESLVESVSELENLVENKTAEVVTYPKEHPDYDVLVEHFKLDPDAEWFVDDDETLFVKFPDETEL